MYLMYLFSTGGTDWTGAVGGKQQELRLCSWMILPELSCFASATLHVLVTVLYVKKRSAHVDMWRFQGFQ